MGSLTSDLDLVRKSILRTLDNTMRNGGVVAASAEARRLVLTYPDCGMLQVDIIAQFRRLAELFGLLMEQDAPATILVTARKTVHLRPEPRRPSGLR